MLIALASGLLACALAPAIHRSAGRAAGWLLPLLPAALALYFASRAPAVWEGRAEAITYEWVPDIGLSLSFRLDGLSMMFALLICSIGALVLAYAASYLAGHPRLGSLYSLLFLFMTSMLGLVLADNLFLLYVFWELTSISSFLLIGFEHERASARAAALKSLLVTAFGGLCLLAGFVLLQQSAATATITEISSRAGALRTHPLYGWMLALVLLGAFTKSAQFPFHFWLPAAMEAPTPVSAYLHSATMVKAGVYLLARLNPALGGTESWFKFVGAVGAITMLAGAWMAIYRTDLKQILAYSTISVLGVLTFLIGVGGEFAIRAMAVYLIAHALYKGALFLIAGGVDHQTGTRDIRQLRGLARSMPFTAVAVSLAAASMAGLPPLLGFLGKELFYEAAAHATAFRVLFTVAAAVTGALLAAAAAMVSVGPFMGGVKTGVPTLAHEAGPGLWLGPLLLGGASLTLAIFPGAIENAVGSAVSAVTAVETAPAPLALFHGLNPYLLLSGASLAGGLALYRFRGVVAVRLPIADWGPSRLYERAVDGINWIAREHTRLIQHGFLRDYVLLILTSVLFLAGTALLRARVPAPNLDLSGLPYWAPAFVLMIIVGTIAAVRSSSRITAIAALGSVGAAVGLIFALSGAPDVAMTLIAAEILTVILLVLILYHLPDLARLSEPHERIRDLALALAVGVLTASLTLVAYASNDGPRVSSYFVENSYSLAHGRNVVNVILTDFRGLDTLGEITVLAVAGVGVYALLKLRP